MEDVATDIIGLEQKAEGLIADILGVDLAEIQGE
jgi:type I restriction enzyme M protein